MPLTAAREVNGRLSPWLLAPQFDDPLVTIGADRLLTTSRSISAPDGDQ
jgi:hypothetical protein